MIRHNYYRYFPLEISKVISNEGEVIYDRGKRNESFCYIDLRTEQTEKQKGD